MKHTPAPWNAHHFGDDTHAIIGKVNGLSDAIIAQVLPSDYDRTPANARLIAAAPELLDCLQWCVGLIDGTHSDTAQDKNEVIELARAAIAKAKGE